MHVALPLTHVLFMSLSVLALTFYWVSGPDGWTLANLCCGITFGALFGFSLLGIGRAFQRFSLRSFNTITIGLLFGYFFGTALLFIFSKSVEILAPSISPQAFELTRLCILLFGIYLGTLLTLRASDEISLSIPFIRFTPMVHQKKDFLIDPSLLSDFRIIDLAVSGLLNAHLVLPRFAIKELYAQAEGTEESLRIKAKRSLDVAKKLEKMADLELRFNDTDFPEIKDLSGKMMRLARLTDANILTADLNHTQTAAAIGGVRFVNLHELSKALKPLMQMGEQIRIKIQRYGKEPHQGVGYLEDGTMVVVNGGGEFLGEPIDAHVLSVKHTSSGRMIFCNTLSNRGDFSDHYTEQPEEI